VNLASMVPNLLRLPTQSMHNLFILLLFAKR
jgi:hypothetical protein